MKKILILCIFVVSLPLLSLVGCKIRIIVPEGGNVRTLSGAYSCASGKTCDIEVVDFFFDETFIAKPASGYKFKFWKKGPYRLCGWEEKPCRVHTTEFEDNMDLSEFILSLFETDEEFYLQPVFEKPVPTGADLWVRLHASGTGLKYCNREGWLWYHALIKNQGPADAKGVVIDFVEELFKVPLDYADSDGPGWFMTTPIFFAQCEQEFDPGGGGLISCRSECTSRLGAISCRITDIIKPGDCCDAKFFSDDFRNTRSRQHRVKITVSGGSEDPKQDNNVVSFERTILPFPKNDGLCYQYDFFSS